VTRDEGDRSPEGGVDWAEVRARLSAIDAAIEGALDLSPERARAVMDERARRLAEAPAKEKGTALEVVTFSLGEERYAVEIRDVMEVMREVDMAPLPGAPPALAGVAAIRGEIAPVLDLKRLLGVRGEGDPSARRLIVLGGERAEIALIADAVGEVTSIAEDELTGGPERAGGPGRRYILGVTRGAVVVLSGAALLGDERIFEGG
jgi:purine-binding chemotaxis protein CheW